MSSHASVLFPLASVLELDDALARSAIRPMVIFKHSPTCGTSACARQEMLDLLAGPPVAADVYLVDVRANRVVSNAVAAQLHIRHESPQVLLIRSGTVCWSTSHFGVTADAVAAALERLATPAA